MQRLLRQLLPFIFMGISIIAVAYSIMFLAYLFLFGAIFGTVLYTINYLREKFFPTKKMPPSSKPSGRIIDANDWHKS